jgi:hypothetical protein
MDEDDLYAIGVMAEYLAGPGFDGWLAYLDRQIAQMAVECPDCGRPHILPSADAETVRANLRRYAQLVG